MLYDAQRWDRPQQIIHPSLLGLISWLKTQDPATTYEWSVYCDRCLLGLYMTAQGYTPMQCATSYVRLANETGSLAMGKPRTYGAALARARALLADPKAYCAW